MIGWLDIETFSKHKLDEVGTDVYSRECEVILAAFAFNDDPVSMWEIGQARGEFQDFLEEAEILVAHNVFFERNCLTRQGWTQRPREDWGCTMAQSFSHALPGALDQLCHFLGVPEDQQKKAEGKKLLRLFCNPQRGGKRYTKKDKPEEWGRFRIYGEFDVVSMRECYKRMPRVNFDACNGIRA